MTTVAAASPTISNTWTGQASSSSVTVAHRLSEDATSRLAVSTSSTLSNPVYSPSASSNTRTAKHTVTGLAANTTYHYGLEVGGALLSTHKGQFKTPPSSTHSFRFGLAGCANSPVSDVAAYLDTSGNLDFHLHPGDIHYADIAVNDQALFDTALDDALAADQGALLRNRASYYTFDDHDYGPNNSDSTSPSRTASLAVFRRRVPAPALWFANATDPVGYSFVRGRVRFIVPDARSAKTTTTIFGAAQWTKIESELAAAKTAGHVAVMVISYPISGTEFIAAERTKLGDTVKSAGMVGSIVILSGDAHMCAFDNGTNHDFATGGGAPLPIIIGGALNAATSIKGGPYSGGTYTQSANQAAIIDVEDTGGATVGVTATMVRDAGIVMGAHNLSLTIPTTQTSTTTPPTVVQETWRGNNATTTSSLSLANPATAGNLIVIAAFVDKSSGAITAPAGFIAFGTAHTTGPGISGALFYKVAAGGEQSFAFSWPTSNIPTMFAQELSGVNASNPIGSVGFTDLNSPLGKGGVVSGPATATANERGIAIFANDSVNNLGGVETWSDEFTQTLSNPSSEGGRPAIRVATRTYSAAGAVPSTTYGYDAGTADEAAMWLYTVRAAA